LLRLDPQVVLLTRGNLTLKFTGSGILEALQKLLTAAEQQALTRLELSELFPETQRSVVSELIDHLTRARVLISAEPCQGPPEHPIDVFYWDVGLSFSGLRRFGSARLGIVGVNVTAKELSISLMRSGMRPATIVDDPGLRNLQFFNDLGLFDEDAWTSDNNLIPIPTALDEWCAAETELDLLVATSDFGAAPLLRRWNGVCVERGWAFYPMILESIRASLGPLVVPGETACFECLYSRENATKDSELRGLSEITMFCGQLK